MGHRIKMLGGSRPLGLVPVLVLILGLFGGAGCGVDPDPAPDDSRDRVADGSVTGESDGGLDGDEGDAAFGNGDGDHDRERDGSVIDQEDGGWEWEMDGGIQCLEPLTLCDGVCVDLITDPAHCGECGVGCAPGEACVDGLCGGECEPGTVECDGNCVLIQVDRENCGGCGIRCQDHESCEEGDCISICDEELTLCEDVCVDLSSDTSHCGECHLQCPDGQFCEEGECAVVCDRDGGEVCDGVCVDINTDTAHCGRCGYQCDEGFLCVDGECEPDCLPGWIYCDEECVDPDTDRFNCGDCRVSCGQGKVCEGGECIISCPDGMTACDGECVYLSMDPLHCGGCGEICGEGTVCFLGECAEECSDDLTDCDGGCVDLLTNRNHCGLCDWRCGEAEVCSEGECLVACPPGLAACDDDCVDLNTDDLNCGYCGNGCLGSEVCVEGACYSQVTGVEISPSEVDLTLDETLQLSVRFTPSDVTVREVIWESSDPEVAHVDEDGVVTGVSVGSATVTVTAEDGGFTDQVEVQVRIPVTGLSLSVTNLVLQPGESELIEALIEPVEATYHDVAWSSDNSSVATVDESGLVSAVGEGVTLVTAVSLDGGYVAECVVTSCVVGDGVALCDGLCVNTEHSMDHCGECGVSCVQGEQVCLGGECVPDCDLGLTLCEGECVDTQSDGRHCGDCNLECDSGMICSGGECALSCGDGLTLCAEGGCVDLDTNRQHCGECFHRCDSGYNCVDGDCVLTCEPGWENCHGVCVNVDDDQDNCGSCGFTCDPGFRCEGGDCVARVTGVNLNESAVNLGVGETVILVATVLPPHAFNTDVVWSSYSDQVATVDPDGTVTGVGAGQSVISVTTVEGSFRAICVVNVRVDVASVELEPSTLSMVVGEESTLTATVLPHDATDQRVVWHSSSPRVAVVNELGEVLAISEGTTVIKVTAVDGGQYATCTVQVGRVAVEGVTIQPEELLLEKGGQTLLVPTVTPANASNTSLLWVSSAPGVATVDMDGLVTAVGGGEAVIMVITADGNHYASCQVRVHVYVAHVSLNKSILNLERGEQVTLQANVMPRDASNTNVSWESDNTLVATVDAQGRIEAVEQGMAEISATTEEGGFVATCTVYVRVPVEGIGLGMEQVLTSVGETVDLGGYVLPPDATEQGITWTSGNSAVAIVSNRGAVMARGVGMTEVTGITVDGNYQASVPVEVRPQVASVTLDRTSLVMRLGDTDTLVATVLPVEALYREVTWASSNTQAVTVDQDGNLIAVGAGVAIITATDGGEQQNGRCTVEVLPVWGGGTEQDPYTSLQPLASCLEYRVVDPQVGDGFFIISRANVETTVYCDMTTDGGGYTFLKVRPGSTNNSVWAEAHCETMGLRLFIPRTENHLLSAFAIANRGDIGPDASHNYLLLMGVYPGWKGALCMNMALTSDNPNCDWVAADGGPFWVSERTDVAEPNGDNDLGISMNYTFSDSGEVIKYNDLVSPGASTDRFICSAGDKY